MGKVKKKEEKIQTTESTSKKPFVVVEYSDLISYCHISEAGNLPILSEAETEEEAIKLQRIKAEELKKNYQY